MRFRMNGEDFSVPSRQVAEVDQILSRYFALESLPPLTDEQREANIQLYTERHDAGLDIFTGLVHAEDDGELESDGSGDDFEADFAESDPVY